MVTHEGHRERMRHRFLEHGLDNFSDVNVLELLLFYAIPRRDTNELAHALLDHFGSLSAVFEASIRELESVTGIGEGAAALIKLIPAMQRRCEIDKTRDMIEIRNAREAGAYLIPRLKYEQNEKVLLICLDSSKKLISCTDLGEGVANEVALSTRRVVELALRQRAASVILAHNHPRGNLSISREDDQLTGDVYAALQLIHVELADHIIVSGDDYVSFKNAGLFGMYHYR